jgi:hypothetical protein
MRASSRSIRIAFCLLALIGLVVPSGAKGQDDFPAQQLAEIYVLHGMPMPPTNAPLVLFRTGSRQMLGIKPSTNDPAIYAPGFLLEQLTNGSIKVLHGDEEEIVDKEGEDDPLWRPFSDELKEPKTNGYIVCFDDPAAFLCAVQLAARDDLANSLKIWKRVQTLFRDDAEPLESREDALKSPPLLLVRYIYNHILNRLMQKPGDWLELYGRLNWLLQDFPILTKDPGIGWRSSMASWRR